MIRYKNVPSLEFDLMNGYLVKVDFVQNLDGTYHLEGYIRDENIKLWSVMSDFENEAFSAPKETVKGEIAKLVTALLTDGYFKKYIDQYEYEQKCFNAGNDMMEN